MKHTGTAVKGYKIKDGKLVKIHTYKLDASAKIKQKKSTRARPVRRIPT